VFRALLAKEWRQLRLLRWLCLGLGVGVVLLLPPVVVWRTGYTAFDAFADLLPRILAWGLWPLAALLASVQAFAADRAQGTESFLLERPVPRRRAWTARFLAAWGTTLFVALGTLAVWLLLGPAHGLEASHYGDALGLMGLVGVTAVFLALMGGMLGATFVASPLTALVLGAYLGCMPAGLAVLLVNGFPHATIGRVPLGLVFSVLLACAYPVVSWAVLCRGEPGGRGRLLRGGVTLAAVLVFLALAFLAAAPLAVRFGAGMTGIYFVSPVAGRHTLAREGRVFRRGQGVWWFHRGVWMGGRAWLVDLETARVTRFLRPRIRAAAWSLDGARIAVATRSAPFGGETNRDRILILDGEGREAGPTTAMGTGQEIVGIRWARDGILLTVLYREAEAFDLLVLDPETGLVRPLKRGLRRGDWGVAGPTEDGGLSLALLDRCRLVGGNECAPGPYGLYAVDLAACLVADEPLLRSTGDPWSARSRLSPDGCYWISGGDWGSADEPLVVRDLVAGVEHIFSEPLPKDEAGADESIAPQAAGEWGNAGRATWLMSGRLFWLEKTGGGRRRMLSAVPGDPPAVDWEWDTTTTHISRLQSPDGSAFLVYRSVGREVFWSLQDPVTGERRELEVGTWATWTWAGPRTLAHFSGTRDRPRGVALEDLDRPGELRWLFGGP